MFFYFFNPLIPLFFVFIFIFAEELMA